MSLAKSLRDIEGTTELELSVESEGAAAAEATARATQAAFTAATIVSIGVVVYWIMQLVSAHAIWNTKYCAFLIDRVQTAYTGGKWHASGITTAMAIESPFVRRHAFSQAESLALDALLFAFTTSEPDMDFVALLNQKGGESNAVAVIELIYHTFTTNWRGESIFDDVCSIFNTVYKDQPPKACNTTPTCSNPRSSQAAAAVMDGVNSGIQTASGIAMAAGMLPFPANVIGIVAGVVGGSVMGYFQTKGEQEAACQSGCGQNC